VSSQVLVTTRAIVSPRPIIGFRNLLREGDITGGDLNAFSGFATDFWETDAGENIMEVELSETTPADYFAIARYTAGLSFVLQFRENGEWENAFSPITPDGLTMVLFDQRSSTRWRVIVTGEGAIADISFGPRLTFERGVFVGHGPETLNPSRELRTNRTERGNPVGRSVLHTGFQSEINVDNLSAAWVRSQWTPFTTHAETLPFYWFWNPLHYPGEGIWAWSMDDETATNERVGGVNQRGFMSVQMPIRGLR
jgi:hypothetical protein